jgi:hypothetical protein
MYKVSQPLRSRTLGENDWDRRGGDGPAQEVYVQDV